MGTEFGIVGLGVMGKSLSRNAAQKGISLSLYNRHVPGQEENVAVNIINSYSEFDEQSQGFDEIESFVESLEQPRKILLMVKAGKAVDALIEAFTPFLEDGDIIIDGGNSHYEDTRRRVAELKKKNMHFIGAGISGGEEGALTGPSIMPGGNQEAYKAVQPYLEKLAAKDKEGNPCCGHIGPDGAGHFVKMVHNGIEYGEMQLIAECYDLLRNAGGKNPEQIADLFETWNRKDLHSFLLSITIDILRVKEDDDYLIDHILDKAGNKGTGSWTTIAAAELGVPISIITSALFSRYFSAFKQDRVRHNLSYSLTGENFEIIEQDLASAYRSARMLNHYQGFQLLKTASESFDWNLNLNDIARIWTNGCILRSDLVESFTSEEHLQDDLLELPAVREQLLQGDEAFRRLLPKAIANGFIMPGLNASYNSLREYTRDRGTAHIIQAQRDYFGAHTYQRTDDPDGKFHHTEWNKHT